MNVNFFLLVFFINDYILLVEWFSSNAVFEISPANSTASILIQERVIIIPSVRSIWHGVVWREKKTFFVFSGGAFSAPSTQSCFPCCEFLHLSNVLFFRHINCDKVILKIVLLAFKICIHQLSLPLEETLKFEVVVSTRSICLSWKAFLFIDKNYIISKNFTLT